MSVLAADPKLVLDVHHQIVIVAWGYITDLNLVGHLVGYAISLVVVKLYRLGALAPGDQRVVLEQDHAVGAATGSLLD